jgi:hypothetical protein
MCIASDAGVAMLDSGAAQDSSSTPDSSPATGSDAEVKLDSGTAADVISALDSSASPDAIGALDSSTSPDSSTTPDSGAAETGTVVAASAGQVGDACQRTSDCAAGLECVAPTASVLGTCDLVSYGLTPTGKSCTGECETAADCCELPAGNALGEFCQVIANQLASVTDCAAAGGPPSSEFELCFDYVTYCGSAAGKQCAAGTWACSNYRCTYSGTCTPGTAEDTWGGCPSKSRAGTLAATTCNSGGKCATSTVEACQTSSDCIGAPAACVTATDCTCRAGTCYVKCKATVDCPTNYTCDANTSLCSETGCSSDGECATASGDVREMCVSGACILPCATDHDCSPSGATTGKFNGSVCVSGACQPVGCSSDADCADVGSGPQMFCVTPPAASAVTSIVSAIVN